jgi:hypothetical protein
MAVAVAASGAAFVHSGAADPLLTAVASRVAQHGSAPAAAPAAGPERAMKVSWSWDLGGPTWNANLPQPSKLTGSRSIAPESPGTPAKPAQPRPPDGTPADDGWPPYWASISATNPKVGLEPMRDCPRYHGPSARIWMDAKVGPGSVTLTWNDLGDPEPTKWMIGAFARRGADDNPTMTWTEVPIRKAGTCGPVSATITGLSSGVAYDFWLESMNRDPLNPSVSTRMSRGRTEVLKVP